jgi:hypothetical protein
MVSLIPGNSIKSTIGTSPVAGNFQKSGISLFPDKFNRLLILLIFIPFFVIKTLNYPAMGIIRAVGAGLKPPVSKAA